MRRILRLIFAVVISNNPIFARETRARAFDSQLPAKTVLRRNINNPQILHFCVNKSDKPKPRSFEFMRLTGCKVTNKIKLLTRLDRASTGKSTFPHNLRYFMTSVTYAHVGRSRQRMPETMLMKSTSFCFAIFGMFSIYVLFSSSEFHNLSKSFLKFPQLFLWNLRFHSTQYGVM